MSRLTRCVGFQNGKPVYATNIDMRCRGAVDKLKNALGDYEDKEEQGLLIELPCKVGDYAWDLISHYRFEIVSIVINSCGNIFFKCGNKGTEDYASFSIEDIGDTWMITEPKESDYWNPRSEAEEALARMKGE